MQTNKQCTTCQSLTIKLVCITKYTWNTEKNEFVFLSDLLQQSALHKDRKPR